MKLTRVNGSGGRSSSASGLEGLNLAVDRRSFLKAAGIGSAGVAALLAPSIAREAQAQTQAPAPKVPKFEEYKTICTKCAVGCGLIGEVENGVWVSQEPWFEHPINRGSMCSKGAAAREHVVNEKRLRYPMKLEAGKWKRISWETAMGEISSKLQDIRTKHGADATMILGSAHHNNEMCYAIRKFSAFWGSNNIDHQARI